MLPADPEHIEGILADQAEPPEVRFVAVMEILLAAMAESSNAATARIGTRLRAFWNADMEKTVIYTPVGGFNPDALHMPPGRTEVDDGDADDMP